MKPEDELERNFWGEPPKKPVPWRSNIANWKVDASRKGGAMSTVMFVGGAADGDLVKVEDDMRAYAVPVMVPAPVLSYVGDYAPNESYSIQTYKRRKVHGEGGVELDLFVHESLTMKMALQSLALVYRISRMERRGIKA